MFNRRSYYVTAMSDRRLAQSTDRKVVSFSTPGSEDNLVLLRADERGHFTPRAIDRRACLLAKTVDTRRVAESVNHGTGHRCRDAGIDGRRGAIVQVNSAF